MKKYIVLVVFLLICTSFSYAQEVIFADYFDIKINAQENSLVTGKIHLKRNKDVLTSAIPSGYSFEIISDNSGLFSLTSKRENINKMKGLLIGELRVEVGQSMPAAETDYPLTIALKNGAATIITEDITIKVVTKTMWESLEEYYRPLTISNSRLYGRTKFSDAEVQVLINEINANNGPITSLNDLFDDIPENIDNLYEKYLETVNHIGGLGYAYADVSSSFFKSSDLRQAIYKSARAFMNNFPVFGDDIVTPFGSDIGDGYQGLYVNGKHLPFNRVTHQWTTIDALGAPLVQVMTELLKDIEAEDPDAIALKESIFRFYQYFFSIVPNKRDMGDPTSSWGDISDFNYSNGAWTDANIHHRMRTIMVIGVIWADYNRPLTYVPYWYDDYYDGTEFEGLTFGRNWSPSGVLNDIRNWCTKFSSLSRLYGQSGFHPDGTVTHHLPHDASDVALRAYGFEWMSSVNTAIGYFENTPLQMEDKDFQFLSDRIDYTYRRILYKQHLDYVVAGRSFYGSLDEFSTKDIKRTVNDLIAGKYPSTIITNEAELIALNNNLQANTHQHSESVAFWNADYLIHRRENNEGNFFFSVKQKSLRTAGAEDFDAVRKSWHAGSGVFQLKVDGYEYTQSVLEQYDWHTLPGVTEEWRIDALPGTGVASDAGPGLNNFSGVLADGKIATSGFFYKPTPSSIPTSDNKLDDLPQYSSATAYKSYHMIDKFGTALGTEIRRKDAGQGKNIVTCIDQSEHNSTIYYSINGTAIVELSKNSSHDKEINLNGPSWVFHKNKGYLIFPETNQTLFIKTGANVNVTDTNTITSSNYILAIDQGVNPAENNLDGYHYVLVADVSQEEMPILLEEYINSNFIHKESGVSHAIYDTVNKVATATFFKASTIHLNEDETDWIKVNKPAIVIREELDKSINLSIVDPEHNLNLESIEIEIPQVLESGEYSYNFKGIEIIDGEKAVVTNIAEGSKIVIYLPDVSDGEIYMYREALLAGAPITLNLLIREKLDEDDDMDGVLNDVDLCPNTTLGSSVDASGCFTLSIDNFDIEAIGETCPDKNNGQLIIDAIKTHNYIARLNETDYNFTTELTLDDLSPGTYDLCISIEGEAYQQCYTITIAAGKMVSAKSSTNKNKTAIEIKEGTAPFHVSVNGSVVLKTMFSTFEIDTKQGDIIEVKTAINCEGTYAETVQLFDLFSIYPNPSDGIFELVIPIDLKQVSIELYNNNSQLLFKKNYAINNGKAQLDLSHFSAGTFFLKVLVDAPITLKIIKK